MLLLKLLLILLAFASRPSATSKRGLISAQTSISPSLPLHAHPPSVAGHRCHATLSRLYNVSPSLLDFPIDYLPVSNDNSRLSNAPSISPLFCRIPPATVLHGGGDF